jgi:hypothetical protein
VSDKAITNPGGAFGVTDAEQKFWYLAAEQVAGAAIAARAAVYLSSDGTVYTQPTNANTTQFVGFSLNAITAGQTGLIVVRGYVSGVVANGAVSAGNLLQVSATSAGAVIASAAPVAGGGVGFAVINSASNFVDVWVSKR